MTENIPKNNSRQAKFVLVLLGASFLFAGLVAYCQVPHQTWKRGRYYYRVLPVRQWNIGTVYCCGVMVQNKTRYSVCRRLDYYGFIVRTRYPHTL